VNTDAPWPDLDEAEWRVLKIQTKLHQWAIGDPHRRFDDLFNLVADPAFLTVAWDRVRGNRGARSAGVDGVAPRSIVFGKEAFLTGLRDDLKARRFTPLPVREKLIPKKILLDIAERLGRSRYFPYRSTREMFEELCVASAGGTADYRGATWERIEDEMGLFWPIPEVGHPGTPRLFEGGRFYHPDRKARFHPVAFRESAEVVDDEYPIWLTTGRVVSQYLSGTQTRRIAGLVDQYPEPLCEMHPRLAERLGVAEGDRVTVQSRRGEMTLPAHVVTTIRPDTVFIPYHWPGAQAANQLTNRAVDPASKMPEFKVAAVRIAPAGGRTPTTDARDLDLTDGHP